MDYSEVKRHVVVALFSDDVLVEQLVLKGGNALELAHHVITRGSIDIDLSIPSEFSDLANTERRIFHALQTHFSRVGFVVFDEMFQAVPQHTGEDSRPWWGGYKVTFKLIDEARATELATDLQKMRVQAQTVDPRQGRTFKVEISKCEYCEGKTQAEVDGTTIYVYTEEMCVIEKLRAICQQMPEYKRTHPTPRARDFYDIYTTIANRAIDLSLPENLEIIRSVFKAKHVPLSLLPKIPKVRDFHSEDWHAVRDSVMGDVFEFDFYFDFVVEEVSRLHALWVE